MTIHDAFLDLASASIDFDLGTEEQAELDRHLASCDTCRATAAAYRSDAEAIAGEPSPGLAPARSVAILATALRPPVRRTAFPPSALATLAAVVAVAIVAAGIYYVRPPDGSLVASPSPGSTGPSAGESGQPGATSQPTAGSFRPAATPASGAFPVRVDAGEIGTEIRMATGPDGALYASIPTPGGTTLMQFDRGGRTKLGWPIFLPDVSCGQVMPVADGSLRGVCQIDDPDVQSGAPVARAFAFDSLGRLVDGWPVDLVAPAIGRAIGDDLVLYLRQPLGTQATPGQPAGNGWIVTIAADGSVRTGTQVPYVLDLGSHTWAIGPDGVAYGTDRDLAGAVPTSRLSAIGFAGSQPGFPLAIEGIASGPAFDAAGRIYVTLGSPRSRPARLLVFDPAGRVVGSSAALDLVATSDWTGTGGEHPAAPLVGRDGRTFIVDSMDGAAITGLSPSVQVAAGWPYASAAELQEVGSCGQGATGCGRLRVAPAVGPDGVLYLAQESASDSAGGSLVAIGGDGQVRDGWPVELRRRGAAFWSIVVGEDGRTHVLAVEPEPVGSSATILSIAPDSTVESKVTIIEP